jgi:hypothetical protein
MKSGHRWSYKRPRDDIAKNYRMISRCAVVELDLPGVGHSDIEHRGGENVPMFGVVRNNAR